MRNLHEAKKKKLATAFFTDIEKHRIENNGKYPRYSSSYKHYNSVFVNLLICQKGVCAYSEMGIYFDYEKCNTKALWESGKFGGNKPKIDADIEHYKAKSRCSGECDWDWNNLFLVSKHINQSIKRDKPVYDFLRPDKPDYAPQRYLWYSFDTQMFVPRPDLDISTYKKVEETLKTLGINSSNTVKSRRKKMLLDYLTDIYVKKYSYQEIKKEKLCEFFTAYEMSEHICTDVAKAQKYINVLKPKHNKNTKK